MEKRILNKFEITLKDIHFVNKAPRMEEIETDRAGIRRLSAEDILLFPCGLPGFKEHQRFCLVHPHGLAPLIYLQSLQPPSPRFILLPAELVDCDYQFEMEPCDREVLYPIPSDLKASFRRASDLSVYFIVSVLENSAPTVNMLAPIAIRQSTLVGVQAVRGDSRYSHEKPLPTPSRDVQ